MGPIRVRSDCAGARASEAWTSATIASAISSALSAPISRPTGACKSSIAGAAELVEHAVRALARAEHADVARGGAEHGIEARAIVYVVVVHHEHRGAIADVDLRRDLGGLCDREPVAREKRACSSVRAYGAHTMTSQPTARACSTTGTASRPAPSTNSRGGGTSTSTSACSDHGRRCRRARGVLEIGHARQPAVDELRARKAIAEPRDDRRAPLLAHAAGEDRHGIDARQRFPLEQDVDHAVAAAARVFVRIVGHDRRPVLGAPEPAAQHVALEATAADAPATDARA